MEVKGKRKEGWGGEILLKNSQILKAFQLRRSEPGGAVTEPQEDFRNGTAN